MDDWPLAKDSGVQISHRLGHALQDFMCPAVILDCHARLHQLVQRRALDVFQKDAVRRRIISQYSPDTRMRYLIQHISLVRNENLIPEIARFFEQCGTGISGELYFGEF